MENVLQVGVELPDGKGVGGVEGQGNHRLHLAQIHLDDAVIVCAVSRGQGLVFAAAAMGFQRFFHCLVGAPDGAEAAGLRGHNVDAAAVVHSQIGYTGAKELHDAVFHGALGERRANQGNGYVLGTDAGPGCAGEVDGNDPGIGDVIGFI